MINRKTALGLLNYAESYLAAAKHLVSEISDQRLALSFGAPIALLTGHGFEILLKSYLRSQGASEIELKNLGHDLVKLLQEARNKGLAITPSDNELAQLDLLNTQFGKPPFYVRYLETGSYIAHDDGIVLNLAIRIDASIRPDIKANYTFE